MTIGDTIGTYGDRTPGIFFHSDSSTLSICNAVNGNGNHCYNGATVSLNKWTQIKVTQEKIETKSKLKAQYNYSIVIGDVSKYNVINKQAKTFENVYAYSGAPTTPALASLTGLTIKLTGNTRENLI